MPVNVLPRTQVQEIYQRRSRDILGKKNQSYPLHLPKPVNHHNSTRRRGVQTGSGGVIFYVEG